MSLKNAPAGNVMAGNAVNLLTDDDIHWFNEGTHYGLQNKLGAHLRTNQDGTQGTSFAVWAPNARLVTVTGDFNNWDKESHRLHPRASSGIWEGFIPNVTRGALYKYHIVSHDGDYLVEKAESVWRVSSDRSRFGLRGLGSRIPVVGRRMDEPARIPAGSQLTHLHLRGAPRFVATRAG